MEKIKFYYVTEFSGEDLDEDTDGYEIEMKEEDEKDICPVCEYRGKVMRVDEPVKIYGCQKCKKYWKAEPAEEDWEDELDD